MKQTFFISLVIFLAFSCGNREEKAFDSFREGLRLIHMGNQDEAFEAIERAIRYDDQQPEYFYHRGNILINRQNFEEGMESYRKALALDSTYYDAWTNMGTAIYYQTGDREKACPYWIRAHKLGKPNLEDHIKHCDDFHPRMIRH